MLRAGSRQSGEYPRGAGSFASKLLMEIESLSRCFEKAIAAPQQQQRPTPTTPFARRRGKGGTVAGGGSAASGGVTDGAAAVATAGLSPEVWERCLATLCGSHSCVGGSGVYYPQLAAWAREAGRFRWIILPGEALRHRAADGLAHVLVQSLP